MKESNTMNDIIKIGNIELTNAEANDLYFNNNRYIVTFRTVYQLHWCENYINSDGSKGGVYGTKVYYAQSDLPLTKRGRWIATNAIHVNKLIGANIFREG